MSQETKAKYWLTCDWCGWDWAMLQGVNRLDTFLWLFA
jgi:hypothetical protein